MKKHTYHVVPGNKSWDIKRSGTETPMARYRTQSEAIEMGRQYAMVEQTELRIHGRDGRIRDSDSYGNDPFPPRDRKY